MAKRDDDRPTLEDCRTWKNDLIGQFGMGGVGNRGLSSAQEDDENLYFQKFSLETPGGKLAVKTGSAPADADAAVDSLVPADIQVRVQPRRAAEKYQKQAKTLALFGRALIQDWRRRRDILRQLAFDQVVRHVAVARQLYDDTLMPRAPDQFSNWPSDQQEAWSVTKRYRNPLVLERRNPRHCAWRQLESGTIAAMVEHYETTVLEARLAFGEYPAATKVLAGRRSNDRIWVDDLWIGAYRCVLIEEQPLFPINGKSQYQGVAKHNYPEIPYMVAPFRELGFDDPGDRYRGLYTNSSGLYGIESSILSMSVWILAWNSWRTWVGWTSDDRDIHIEPGKLLQIDKRKNEYIEMLTGDPLPPELLNMVGIFDSYLNRNGISGGPRGTGDNARSAQQIWAQVSERQRKLDPAKESLQEMMANGLRFSLIAMEHLVQEPLTLPCPGLNDNGDPMGSVTLRPSDIDGYYDACDVTFGARLDPAQLEQAKALSVFAQNNWMPLKKSWELSGLTPDPDEWEAGLVRQAVERLPFMVEMMALEATKAWWGENSYQYQLLLKRTEQAEPDLSGEQQAAPPGSPGVPAGSPMQPMGQGGGMNTPVGQDLEQAIQQQHRRAGGKPPGRKAPPGAMGSQPRQTRPG